MSAGSLEPLSQCQWLPQASAPMWPAGVTDPLRSITAGQSMARKGQPDPSCRLQPFGSGSGLDDDRLRRLLIRRLSMIRFERYQAIRNLRNSPSPEKAQQGWAVRDRQVVRLLSSLPGASLGRALPPLIYQGEPSSSSWKKRDQAATRFR